MKRFLALFLIATCLLSGEAFAGGVKRQTPPRGKSGASMRARLIGMALGAGAGFGLGMVTALRRLPDASCTDRKVVIAAGSFGTIGGMFGYWAGARTGPAAQRQMKKASEWRPSLTGIVPQRAEPETMKMSS